MFWFMARGYTATGANATSFFSRLSYHWRCGGVAELDGQGAGEFSRPFSAHFQRDNSPYILVGL
jgi:hypothetical protein